jgi:thiol-disulfide isomerase/thioredoxin
MKKIIIFITSLFLTATTFSQYDTTPPYLKTKVVPDFVLLSIDSAAFTQSVLAPNKNTIIMLFNPDCGHCQEQLELLLTIPEVLKTTTLILATTEPLKKIKKFYDKYQLKKHSWVYIGKDTKYFFGSYYKPRTIPVLAFYNKQKQFVYFNQGNVKKKEIIKALKK